MTDKKQSGYQKIKAENEQLQRDIFKLLYGTDQEKEEVKAKHSEK